MEMHKVTMYNPITGESWNKETDIPQIFVDRIQSALSDIEGITAYKVYNPFTLGIRFNLIDEKENLLKYFVNIEVNKKPIE